MACPFKMLASASDELVSSLKRSPGFATGCPLASMDDRSTTAQSVLDGLLASLNEHELNDVITLLRAEGEALRARLGIDGSGWEVLLGKQSYSPPADRSSTRRAREAAVADEMDQAREEAVRKRRAAAAREAEAQLLSTQLKHGTKEIHAAAENVQFVREFIQGRCSRATYTAMVKDLYHVYVALEEAVERCSCDDGPHATLDFSYELARVPALEADLHFLCGPQWRTADECKPSAAAHAYASRLRELADERPELLVAHTYTRYLGDLSGGRVLMRVAKRLLGPRADERDGVAFYTFDNIPQPKLFKQRYRAAMDTLPVDEKLVAELVAEANAAFELNIRLFHELDRLMALEGHVAPSPPPAGAAPASRTPEAGTAKAAAFAGGCPFAQYIAEGRPVPEGAVCQRLAAEKTRSEAGEAMWWRWAQANWSSLLYFVMCALVYCGAVRAAAGGLPFVGGL